MKMEKLKRYQVFIVGLIEVIVFMQVLILLH